MTMQEIATALQRAEAVLCRRPQFGIHDDAPATSRWQSGTRVLASHANGRQIPTDMPEELGGSGDQVSPGWLFRAGLGSCAATVIAMGAAADGIELTALEVVASSRSDTRGLLGMSDADGGPVHAGAVIVVTPKIRRRRSTRRSRFCARQCRCFCTFRMWLSLKTG